MSEAKWTIPKRPLATPLPIPQWPRNYGLLALACAVATRSRLDVILPCWIFCPDLLVLACGELDSLTDNASCEVSFRDYDGTFNQGCDSQTCTVGPQGLTCTPGPDPGVSTIITCANAVLDCTGDGIPDPSCTINSDTPGTISEVDDTFVANFYVACVSPASGGTPGAAITCTANTSDGDLDCDAIKIVAVSCPDLSP